MIKIMKDKIFEYLHCEGIVFIDFEYHSKDWWIVCDYYWGTVDFSQNSIYLLLREKCYCVRISCCSYWYYELLRTIFERPMLNMLWEKVANKFSVLGGVKILNLIELLRPIYRLSHNVMPSLLIILSCSEIMNPSIGKRPPIILLMTKLE